MLIRLKEKIERLHLIGYEDERIIELITNHTENEIDDEVLSLLARAYLNFGDFDKGLIILEGITSDYQNNPLYDFRMGAALMLLKKEDKAIKWFQAAQKKGLLEVNEFPTTYYPKKVDLWVERAETWGPRRIEKNNFERQMRQQRKKKLTTVDDLSDFDFTCFWDDSKLVQENYCGKTPTEEEIKQAEATLGYKLPESYKTLIKKHNGGRLEKDTFDNPLQTNWTSTSFNAYSIYGIDPSKEYSLLGDMGNHFWIDQWDYPEIGLVIADTFTAGHDMIFLDYTDCGADGEPCVVHVNQENNFEITYLADTFSDFVKGLYQSE